MYGTRSCCFGDIEKYLEPISHENEARDTVISYCLSEYQSEEWESMEIDQMSAEELSAKQKALHKTCTNLKVLLFRVLH